MRSVGGAVRAVPWIDLGDAGVLDAKLLTEQMDLLRESVVLGCRARGFRASAARPIKRLMRRAAPGVSERWHGF